MENGTEEIMEVVQETLPIAKASRGGVIGAVVLGVAGIGAVVGAVIYAIKRKRKKATQEEEESDNLDEE